MAEALVSFLIVVGMVHVFPRGISTKWSLEPNCLGSL